VYHRHRTISARTIGLSAQRTSVPLERVPRILVRFSTHDRRAENSIRFSPIVVDAVLTMGRGGHEFRVPRTGDPDVLGAASSGGGNAEGGRVVGGGGDGGHARALVLLASVARAADLVWRNRGNQRRGHLPSCVCAYCTVTQ